MTLPGGFKGQSRASVASNFDGYMRQLRAAANNMQNAFQAKAQRAWMAMAGDGLDPANMPDTQFDRQELNTMYDQITNNENYGTTGDVIAVKLQIDYIAAAERAMRARHCSLPRSAALAHGRRYGHAHGAVFSDGEGGIQYAVSNYIRAGSATMPEQAAGS